MQWLKINHSMILRLIQIFSKKCSYLTLIFWKQSKIKDKCSLEECFKYIGKLKVRNLTFKKSVIADFLRVFKEGEEVFSGINDRSILRMLMPSTS